MGLTVRFRALKERSLRQLASFRHAGPQASVRETRRLCLILAAMLFVIGSTIAASDPLVVQNVTVYRQPGRFAGWPANNGIWNWGNEILVGFDAGFFKVQRGFHAIDYDRAEEQLLARSLDGGNTWRIEKPPSLLPPPGWKMGFVPLEAGGKEATDCPGGIDFTSPGFALTARMMDYDVGPSRFYYSYDRGHTWSGPFRVPSLGTKGIAARTDYLVDGPKECTTFLTAAKEDGKEGRVLCARTLDGGKTWERVGWVSSWREGFSIMPSSVRLSKDSILTAVRRETNEGNGLIELLRSDDNGRNWVSVSMVMPRPGNQWSNPPSMLMLRDGRLCVTYGYRETPFGIRARLSADKGKTWGDELILRSDGGGPDLGYTRTVQRSDGKLVTIYYFNERTDEERYIGATIWDPGPLGQQDSSKKNTTSSRQVSHEQR